MKKINKISQNNKYFYAFQSRTYTHIQANLTKDAIINLRTGCGRRIAEHLTISLHMSRLRDNVGVCVKDLPVYQMTSSDHFSFSVCFLLRCYVVEQQWIYRWLLWRVHTISTSWSISCLSVPLLFVCVSLLFVCVCVPFLFVCVCLKYSETIEFYIMIIRGMVEGSPCSFTPDLLFSYNLICVSMSESLWMISTPFSNVFSPLFSSARLLFLLWYRVGL